MSFVASPRWCSGNRRRSHAPMNAPQKIVAKAISEIDTPVTRFTLSYLAEASAGGVLGLAWEPAGDRFGDERRRIRLATFGRLAAQPFDGDRDESARSCLAWYASAQLINPVFRDHARDRGDENPCSCRSNCHWTRSSPAAPRHSAPSIGPPER